MTRKNLACTLMASALSFTAAHAATAPSTWINAGGSSLAYPTYVAEFGLYTAGHAAIGFDYAAVGSGAGQSAFLNNTISSFQNLPAGTLSYNTPVGTQVDIGASDAALSASQLTVPATGSYGTATVGSAVDGPLIQIPTIGVPVAMAYTVPVSTLTGAVALTDGMICGVLSGKITDWHSLVASVPAGHTIHVVYRSDSSGTTFLTTQHLNAVCNATNSNFVLPVSITKTYAATMFKSGTFPANFVGESGSGAVATQILANAGSFGYLSPDYTSIAPLSANTHAAIKVANVYNAISKAYYAPNVANTESALTHPYTGTLNGVVITSTNGTPPATKAAAQNPLNWVPLVPMATTGYPIVGYTTMDLSSCYANKTAAAAINTFLYAQYYTAAYVTIIKNNGFAPLANTGAVKYTAAVNATFLNNTSTYNLNIDNATLCAGKVGR